MRKYIGKRYVPTFYGEWGINEEYEALTVVTNNNDSYISKTNVPSGIPLSNTDYWVLSGKYNQDDDIYALPERFGAKGDGVTDDSDAIQSAINTGKTVKLSNKTYAISKPLLLDSKQSITGLGKESTFLKALASMDYMILTNDKSYCCEIKDMTLNGNHLAGGIHNVATEDSGLVEYDVRHIIKNVMIRNCVNRSLYIDQFAREVLLDNVHIYGCDNGFEIYGTDNKISNCTAGEIASTGLTVRGSNCSVNNVKVFCANKFIDGYSAILSGNYENVSNLSLQQNYHHAIKIDSSYSNINNLLIDWNNYSKSSGAKNVVLNGTYNMISGTIFDGRFNCFNEYAFFINDSAKNNTINVNVVRQNGSCYIEDVNSKTCFLRNSITINGYGSNPIDYMYDKCNDSFVKSSEKTDYSGEIKDIENGISISIRYTASDNPSVDYGNTARQSNIPIVENKEMFGVVSEIDPVFASMKVVPRHKLNISSDSGNKLINPLDYFVIKTCKKAYLITLFNAKNIYDYNSSNTNVSMNLWLGVFVDSAGVNTTVDFTAKFINTKYGFFNK